jgi:hypothetical protein
VKEREKAAGWAGWLLGWIPSSYPGRPSWAVAPFFVLFFFFIFCLQFCLFGNISVWFWLTFKFCNFCNYVKVFANKSVLLGEV